jgi:aldehyde:ferredoxin oxidoreductase
MVKRNLNLPGYTGRILRVDLSAGTTWIDEPDELFYRTYMGGWGFIAYYLLQETATGLDPFDPDNLLIFATGPVTGVPTAGAGRHVIGAKSALTGGFGAAEAGGYWGAELTKAGFDAVVISGSSSKPVYLLVRDGTPEIRAAENLWGMLTAETERAIRKELQDDRVRIACIGPAGERLCRISGIMHEVNRAAGRTGLGAVMGSKKLKAVVVRGSETKQLADRAALLAISREFNRSFLGTWLKDLQDVGTSSGILFFQSVGALPTRNFSEGVFSEAEQISGETMRDTILKKRDTCYACPVRCKRVVEIESDDWRVDPVYGGPEYESIAALGASCGIGDLGAVAKANELCNAYGLDTISVGTTIAWAMECFQRGLIGERDTGGIDLRFGNAQALLQTVELVGNREGFGRLLGEGSLRASQELGRGSEACLVQIKGQEVPMHDPRVKFGHGVGYAVSPTGADHMHNFHDSDYTEPEAIASLKPFGVLEPLEFDDLGPAKMRMASILIPWNTLANVIGCCLFTFPVYKRTQIAAMIQAITGWETSVFELYDAGLRAYSLARVFNQREGFSTDEDTLPERFFQHLPGGPASENRIPKHAFAQAKETLYKMWGWDDNGTPTSPTLHRLGVGWADRIVEEET